jgi:TPR repeat protein
MLAGVGIVPIGMLASAFHAVWPQVGDLALGLVLTYGARMVAIMLAKSMDRDEASINSNSTSESTSPISRSLVSYATEKWRASLRFDRIKRLQIIGTGLYVLVVGGFEIHEALNPNPAWYDYQQVMVNLKYHPIASVLGGLAPVVILAPFTYWMFGRILRRNAARFKICEQCAETVKAEAKVCRYCGRDVAPARQVEVEVRQRTENEQRRPGAGGNRLEPVQAASAAVRPISPTDQAQSRNPRQLSRPAVVTSCVLGLVLFGSVGVWLADTHRTLVAPSTKLAADPIDEADSAYRKGDYATALRLIRPLADRGNAISQAFLGAMYASGDGVPRNDAEAVRWFRLAADKGNAAAQNLLGTMYSTGKGVPRNDTEAVRWLRLAADQDNVAAQNNLGMAYENGVGVPRNSAEAARWYRLAADRGFVDAQFNLGQIYFAGPVEMQNSVEAVKWFRRAADKGNAAAQYFLGIMYADGRAVKKNYVNAYIWSNLAAAQGDRIVGDVAVKLRDLVEHSLTPVQLAEAQRFVRDWRPKSASGDALLSDAEFGLLSDAPTPKQSAQGGAPPAWHSLAPSGPWEDYKPDAPQPRPR